MLDKTPHALQFVNGTQGFDSVLDDIRERVFNAVLIAFILLAVPTVLASLGRATYTGLKPVMGLQVGTIAVYFALWVLRHRLPYRFKVFVLIGDLLLLGAGGLYTFGLIGMGLFLLVTACLLFVIFVGGRAAPIALLVSSGLIAIIGLEIVQGAISLDFDQDIYASSVRSWIVALLTFALIMRTVIYAWVQLQEALSDTVLKLNARRAELYKANVELEAEIDARQQVEVALQNAKQELESKVAERTQALQQANQQLEQELVQRQRAQDRYRRLFEEAPVMYVITHNREGVPVIADCNRRFLETLGCDHSEVVGRLLGDFYSPESRAELLNGGYRRALENRFTLAERQLVTREGRIVETIAQGTPVVDSQGHVIGTRAMFTDVTERNRTERKFRGFLETTLDAVVIVNQEGQIVLVNAQTEQLFGYARDELLNQNMQILVPERFRARHLEHLVQFFLDPRVRPMGLDQRLYGLKRNGHEFPAEISLSPMEAEEGVLVSAAIRDVSERVQAEAALRASEQTYRTLFEHANDAIFLMNLEGVHLKVNQRAIRMLGYRRDELVGMGFHEIVAPRDYPDAENKLQALLAGLSLPTYERWFRNKAGDEFPVEINVALVHDAEGKPTFIQSIVRDITRRKRTQQALQRLAEQRKRLLEVTRSMLATLSLDDVIGQILQALQEILSYDVCALYWIDEVQGVLRPYQIAGQEWMAGPLREWAPTIGQGIAGVVAQSGQAELVNDAYLDPRSAYPDEAKGLREHLISVPVQVHGKTVGVFNLARITGNRFTPEDLELVQLFVAQAAIAIQNAQFYTELEQHAQMVEEQSEQMRALARRLAEAQEAERKELARELHDRVGQTLTALDFHLNIIRSQVPNDSPQCAHILNHIDTSLTLLSETAARVRDVMAELRPPVLDDRGLLAALRWFGDRIVAPQGVTISVQGDEPAPRLAPPAELALFRVAQEALTNVLKHARAKQVKVTVETAADDDMVCLEVVDDGVGLQSAHRPAPTDRHGWGLISMAERAEAVGGRLEIDSCPQSGTRVRVEVPR